MKTIHESVRLACTPDAFWKLHLDATYTKALYADAPGFRHFEVLELGETHRKARVVPRLNLPGPLAKLVGDSFAYEEHGTLDREKGEWRWQMVQPASVGAGARPSALVTRGTIRVVADGAEGCRRTDVIEVESKLFGLGGMLEGTVERELRGNLGREVAFLGRWIEKARGK